MKHYTTHKKTPREWAVELGERLKLARLNINMTQEEVARRCGLSRTAVVGVEKGRAQLETFISVMQALDLTATLDLFLPPQLVSPVQLAKLAGKQRQRASSNKTPVAEEPDLGW